MQFKMITETLRAGALRMTAVAVLGVLAAGLAQAQAYPARPITFIYPYAAGSLVDNAWRATLVEVSKRLGQQVVMENRPGAGGRTGTEAVMKAAPDGYTLGGGANAVIVVQALIEPRLFIEPVKHYTPVITGFETYLLLVARNGTPYRDVKGLIAYAKANPGKINGGSPGAGTGSHLSLSMLATKGGIDFPSIHYKGSAPTLTAILSGEVDIYFADPGAKPHIDAGKMQGIAVTGPQRWASFPNLPTMQEAGLSGFTFASWHSVIAPPGLPQDLTTTINRAFNDALNLPDLRGKLEAVGWVVKGGTPAELNALIKSDLDLFRPIVRAANIKLD